MNKLPLQYSNAQIPVKNVAFVLKTATKTKTADSYDVAESPPDVEVGEQDEQEEEEKEEEDHSSLHLLSDSDEAIDAGVDMYEDSDENEDISERKHTQIESLDPSSNVYNTESEDEDSDDETGGLYIPEYMCRSLFSVTVYENEDNKDSEDELQYESHDAEEVEEENAAAAVEATAKRPGGGNYGKDKKRRSVGS
jgi:hypothetical protein